MVYKGQYDTIIIVGAVIGGLYLLNKSNFFESLGTGLGKSAGTLGDIGQGLGTGLAGIGGGVYGLGTGLGGGLFNIGTGFEYLGKGVGGGVYEVGAGAGNLLSGGGELFSKAGDIFTGFGNMETSFGLGMESLFSRIGAIDLAIQTKLGSMNLNVNDPINNLTTKTEIIKKGSGSSEQATAAAPNLNPILGVNLPLPMSIKPSSTSSSSVPTYTGSGSKTAVMKQLNVMTSSTSPILNQFLQTIKR